MENGEEVMTVNFLFPDKCKKKNDNCQLPKPGEFKLLIQSDTQINIYLNWHNPDSPQKLKPLDQRHHLLVKFSMTSIQYVSCNCCYTAINVTQ